MWNISSSIKNTIKFPFSAWFKGRAHSINLYSLVWIADILQLKVNFSKIVHWSIFNKRGMNNQNKIPINFLQLLAQINHFRGKSNIQPKDIKHVTLKDPEFVVLAVSKWISPRWSNHSQTKKVEQFPGSAPPYPLQELEGRVHSNM